MFNRHNKTFWYRFYNFKYFLKAENSEDSLGTLIASSCQSQANTKHSTSCGVFCIGLRLGYYCQLVTQFSSNSIGTKLGLGLGLGTDLVTLLIKPGGHLYFRLDIVLVKGLTKHILDTYFSGMKIHPKYTFLHAFS